jgi:leucine-zipper-like transcriptional regulator 1
VSYSLYERFITGSLSLASNERELTSRTITECIISLLFVLPVVFGGYDGSYKNDMHEYDLLSSRWGVVPAAGRRPRARYRSTLCVHKSSVILFGGHDGTRHLQDLHVFDLETRIWTSLVCEGVPPTPRDSHVSVMHGNCMYVFGGSSGSAMNDLHELQLPSVLSANEAAKWRAVYTARTDLPQPRFCHVACVYNDSMCEYITMACFQCKGDNLSCDV